MKKYKVVITDFEYKDVKIEEAALLSSLDVEIVKGQCKTESEVIELARNADAILNQYAPISGKVIDALENCKIISTYGVGVDTIDIEAASRRNMIVANVPDYAVEEVSNHALALLFSAARKVVELNNLVKKGSWDVNQAYPIYRFSYQTLGVLGFGRIPRSLVRKAKAFEWRILVHDPYVSEEEILQLGAEPATFGELLRESDFLTIHTPLTEETAGLIGREELSLMKENAILINTARGPLIKEQELIEALQNRVIAGAALDVFAQEPVAKDHPFLSMDNVIVTPHIAWYSEEAMIELRTKAINNIIQFLQGGIPPYVVNKNILRNL